MTAYQRLGLKVRQWIGGLNKLLEIHTMPSVAKVNVSEDSVMGLAAYWCGVNQIADAVSALPLTVRKRIVGGRDEEAPDHPLAQLFKTGVCGYLGEKDFTKMVVYHRLTHGNSYWRIHDNHRGQIETLQPLLPDRTKPVVNFATGDIYYNVADSVTGRTASHLPAWEVLHIKGLTRDGIWGLSPIAVMRDNLGLGIAAERYGSKFFANDATPSGILSTEQVLDDDTVKKMSKGWIEAHGGEKQRSPAVLHGGITYQPIALPPGDSQFLQTRVHSIQDVGRILGCPPSKLYDPSHSTYNNIAQEDLAFHNDTVKPLAISIADELNRQLMPNDEYYFAFDLVGGQAGTQTDRFRSYSIGLKAGFISKLEVRRAEGLPDETPEETMGMDEMDDDDTIDAEYEVVNEEERLLEFLGDSDRRVVQHALTLIDQDDTDRRVKYIEDAIKLTRNDHVHIKLPAPPPEKRAVIPNPDPDTSETEDDFRQELLVLLGLFGQEAVEQITQAQLDKWRQIVQDAIENQGKPEGGKKQVMEALGLTAILDEIRLASSALSDDDALDDYADALSNLLQGMYMDYAGEAGVIIDGEDWINERVELLQLVSGAEHGVVNGVLSETDPAFDELAAQGVFTSLDNRAEVIMGTEVSEARNRVILSILGAAAVTDVFVLDCRDGCDDRPDDVVCINRANTVMPLAEALTQRLAHPHCTLGFQEIT